MPKKITKSAQWLIDNIERIKKIEEYRVNGLLYLAKELATDMDMEIKQKRLKISRYQINMAIAEDKEKHLT